jgi:hypothetical protein
MLMSSPDNSRVTKVCFIAPKAYPLFNRNVKEIFGGAEMDLYLLSTELAKDKDFAVNFITADYGQAHTEKIEGIRLIKSVNFNKNPRRFSYIFPGSSLMGYVLGCAVLHLAQKNIHLSHS